MGSHNSKNCKKLFKEMRKHGVLINERNGRKSIYIISHPKAKEAYYCHFGENAIIPLKRWIKRNLGLDL